jgi:ATP-dependent Lhr-like helicase
MTANPDISSGMIPPAIPKKIEHWFAAQDWTIRDYQRDMVGQFGRGQDTLLIAPTGGGKTLAGFLPSLCDLAEKDPKAPRALHTLYISPLRALTNDIERNLMRPVGDLDLPIEIGVRTGDTKSYQRKKQQTKPPDILLTTPESLMLLLSYETAPDYFASLQCVVIDEMHSFTTGKRGDFTALALARLKTLAPDHVRFGLSATIAAPDKAAEWLGPTGAIDDILHDDIHRPGTVGLAVAMPVGNGFNGDVAFHDFQRVCRNKDRFGGFINTVIGASDPLQQARDTFGRTDLNDGIHIAPIYAHF